MSAPAPVAHTQPEPPRPGPVAETIQTLLRERRHDELVALAERTVAAAPDNAEAWNLLAVALRRMRRDGAAIACLRRALDLDPDNPTAMLNLGGACGDTGRPAEAAAWYRKVLARQPSAIVWTHLGVALDETGDPAAALDAYDTALALDPAYARCHVERAHAPRYTSMRVFRQSEPSRRDRVLEDCVTSLYGIRLDNTTVSASGLAMSAAHA